MSYECRYDVKDVANFSRKFDHPRHEGSFLPHHHPRSPEGKARVGGLVKKILGRVVVEKNPWKEEGYREGCGNLSR